eukprot:scaffold13842_cov115-Isochrysis_galbana.AAC.9
MKHKPGPSVPAAPPSACPPAVLDPARASPAWYSRTRPSAQAEARSGTAASPPGRAESAHTRPGWGRMHAHQPAPREPPSEEVPAAP